MRRFTFIAISFIPQTVTAGFFGMNVTVPYLTQVSSVSLVPFWIIVACTFSVTIIGAIIFRYLNYI